MRAVLHNLRSSCQLAAATAKQAAAVCFGRGCWRKTVRCRWGGTGPNSGFNNDFLFWKINLKLNLLFPLLLIDASSTWTSPASIPPGPQRFAFLRPLLHSGWSKFEWQDGNTNGNISYTTVNTTFAICSSMATMPA